MNQIRKIAVICFFLFIGCCALFLLSLFIPVQLSTRFSYNPDIALQLKAAYLSHDSNVYISKQVDKEPILAILNRAKADHVVQGALSDTFYGSDAGFFYLYIDGVSLGVSENFMQIHRDPPKKDEYVRLLNGEAKNLWDCLSEAYFFSNP